MRLDDLNEALNRTRDWIDNADVKTSILITTLAVALGFTAFEVKDTKEILLGPGGFVMKAALLGIWMVYLFFLLFSLYHSLRAITPHPESLKERLIRGRLPVTDFPSIVRATFEEYTEAVRTTDDEQIRQELTELLYYFSQIASHKFEHFLKAMSAFRFAFAAQVIIFTWISLALPSGP